MEVFYGAPQTGKIREGIKLKFVEYSENKKVSISPNIMEYDEDNYDPKFDLIIGIQPNPCKSWSLFSISVQIWL